MEPLARTRDEALAGLRRAVAAREGALTPEVRARIAAFISTVAAGPAHPPHAAGLYVLEVGRQMQEEEGGGG